MTLVLNLTTDKVIMALHYNITYIITYFFVWLSVIDNVLVNGTYLIGIDKVAVNGINTNGIDNVPVDGINANGITNIVLVRTAHDHQHCCCLP